jgi:hypothetical protein
MNGDLIRIDQLLVGEVPDGDREADQHDSIQQYGPDHPLNRGGSESSDLVTQAPAQGDDLGADSAAVELQKDPSSLRSSLMSVFVATCSPKPSAIASATPSACSGGMPAALRRRASFKVSSIGAAIALPIIVWVKGDFLPATRY